MLDMCSTQVEAYSNHFLFTFICLYFYFMMCQLCCLRLFHSLHSTSAIYLLVVTEYPWSSSSRRKQEAAMERSDLQTSSNWVTHIQMTEQPLKQIAEQVKVSFILQYMPQLYLTGILSNCVKKTLELENRLPFRNKGRNPSSESLPLLHLSPCCWVFVDIFGGLSILAYLNYVSLWRRLI